MEPDGWYRNYHIITEQYTLTVFGLFGIALKCILTTIDFQGLMMELPNFQLHYQTLKANHGQSVFHDNSNNRKHRSDTLFYYRVLVPTFRLHHQTLKIVHGQSTSVDDFYKTKHG
ncbi:hypothetical protein EVAR_45434_1 [Eumeta japonica]|uniref:Uncharacterized protein n=1 Tax=Eumeta variegata TaxID=151549 RepID=A0A4C1YLL4_EUMVA|nr:hypothetical protein EVAR_45434_1 [Eumeta japonica]